MTQLSDTLEALILSALINGHLALTTVRRNELSRTGQFVFDGLSRLGKSKQPPYSAKTVLSAASDIAGGDPDVLRPYIQQSLDAGDGKSAETILAAVHDKQTLLDLVNLAGAQMATGGLDRQAFLTKLGPVKTVAHTTLQPVSAHFAGNRRHTMPEGVPLLDLPRLQSATHGLYGVWALSGDSGVGKSTLTLELAVQVGRSRPVLFYDYENGQPVLLSHLSQAFNNDNKKIRHATSQLYFREGIHTLDSDLAILGQPCLVVVDSIQKIAVRGGEDKRAGLEKWVHHLETLKFQGHCVLMVSEKSRAFYGRTGQAGYKESGEIEYTVDVGLELLEVKGSNGVVEVSLNKNRNWPHKGFITTMSRVNNWWFKEAGGTR
jgi:hypothetical protein